MLVRGARYVTRLYVVVTLAEFDIKVGNFT
jgi:hypothetical protein